ncbi:hypothetical protein KUV51_17755 [Tateyamaria omphalii]|uniref:hypothetical protein n=1 Tax=Tateyamaria omphalii TaxID=299262 RepID=UPI001C994727|nr:hypothetical protein [Tateyamaria omphalii]MBY5934858.1 hypothetical protein [Tateyamaria omphalii]
MTDNNIIVTGTRPQDPWIQSIYLDDLYAVGQFDLNAALFGNPMPGWGQGTVTDPSSDRPVVRSDQPKEASEGQEDFAEDGDPFNDGEAPTLQTVEAWLEAEAAADQDMTYLVSSDVSDPDAYSGWYTTGDGDTFTFYSDGEGGYGLTPVAPEPSGDTGADLGLGDGFLF